MKGLYEAPTEPRTENEVARLLEWDGRLSMAQTIGAAILILTGPIALLTAGTPAGALLAATWRIGAILLLCACGHSVMLSWRRRSRRIRSVSAFIAHRFRRLAPVHLASFGLVSIIVSLRSLTGTPEEANATGMALTLLPFWPTDFMAYNNPPWFVIQAILVGTLIVPVISMLRERWTMTAFALAGMACVSMAPDDSIWSISGPMIVSFMTGAVASRAHRTEKKSGRIQVIAGIIALSFGQALGEVQGLSSLGNVVTAVGAVIIIRWMPERTGYGSRTRLTAYCYPAMVLHYPVLRYSLANTDSDMLAIALAIPVTAALVLATGRMLERPNIANERKRTQDAESAQIHMDETSLMLPSHPENGNNPAMREKRSRDR
jgi:peptidoglycan/LPS O-acetylase OafA/YrhL